MVACILRAPASIQATGAERGGWLGANPMSRWGSLFIREVNMALGGVLAVAVVAAGAHYVSVVHEMHRMKQELCGVNLTLLVSRNPYLKLDPPPADPCAALMTLTGERVTMPAPARRRTGV